MGISADEGQPSDVLLVAHGHILRAFAMRWIGRQLTDGVSLLLEGNVNRSDPRPENCADLRVAGGVGTLRYAHGIMLCPMATHTDCSYEHHKVDEPAILYVRNSFMLRCVSLTRVGWEVPLL